MTASSSTSDRKSRPLWVAVSVGASIGAVLSLLIAEPLRRALFDEWQVIAPRKIDGRRVAVVLIDPESLAEVGPWPWPRYYLARLTEKIAMQQPKAIGFDMIFPETDRLNPDRIVALYPELEPNAAKAVKALPSMDESFAQVLGASPVVLGRLGIAEDGRSPGDLFVDPEIDGRPPPGSARYAQVLASIPALDDVALGHAMLNGPPDSDGVVRRVPLAIMAGTRPMAGLAVELARIAAGEPKLTWRGAGMDLGRTRLPADESGSFQLRFGRFPTQATFSAASVLRQGLAAHTFRNKIVLVGLGAEGTADLVATPLETEGYGVFVQAQAVDAILHRGWLSRPLWLAGLEWAAGALLALLVVLGGKRARRRPAMIAAAAAAASLPVLSWVLFAHAGLLFDPLRPITIGLGAIAGLSFVLVARGRADRLGLARALVEQRVSSAIQDGELQAARKIQLGMVPTPDRLAGLDARVGASAALEPARSVGGDFYDAVRIDADHILFLIGDVTGKGVPAALYMALSKTLAKSVLVRERGGLAHAVSTLNRELMREADEDMGLTLLVVLIDCASGSLTMVNAGHENPIVIRSGALPETVPMQGGPPLCVVDFSYPEEPLILSRGDTLVLITDGVSEAENEGGDLLGVGGAIDILAAEQGGDPAEIAARLVAAVRRFEHPGEPSDDLTVLTLTYRG